MFFLSKLFCLFCALGTRLYGLFSSHHKNAYQHGIIQRLQQDELLNAVIRLFLQTLGCHTGAGMTTCRIFDSIHNLKWENSNKIYSKWDTCSCYLSYSEMRAMPIPTVRLCFSHTLSDFSRKLCVSISVVNSVNKIKSIGCWQNIVCSRLAML